MGEKVVVSDRYNKKQTNMGFVFNAFKKGSCDTKVSLVFPHFVSHCGYNKGLRAYLFKQTH